MSQLQQQLQKLQGQDRSGGKAQAKKESLLFAPSEAATLDYETCLNLAVNGLLELEKLDSRFSVFQETLFSPSSKERTRALLTKQENEEIDRDIAELLILLSPFTLLKAAHKVFEYLVKRYQVQARNVDDVMLCILPYHQTTAFVGFVKVGIL